MSSLSPPSFIDDGTSFQKRAPRNLSHLRTAKWIASTDSAASTSAYTGSFIDDGADMRTPYYTNEPGFGKVDKRFYKQRKKKDRDPGLWNDDIKKAVEGDIKNSLRRINDMGHVDVRRTGQREDKGRKTKRGETVSVPVPTSWGTFVIKDTDGRIVVVDETGEYDSGRVWMDEKGYAQEQRKQAKARTKSDADDLLVVRDKRAKEHGRHRSREGRAAPRVKSLSPIRESSSDDYEYQLSDAESLGSPTGFFMTGGASGWPLRQRSPSKSSRIRRRSSPGSPGEQKAMSPAYAPFGGWQSPPRSANKSVVGSERSTAYDPHSGAWARGSIYGSDRSGKPRKSRQNHLDNVSIRTYSTYMPPTVEDAPDTSSESFPLTKPPAWDSGHGGPNIGNSFARSTSKHPSEHSHITKSRYSDEGWDGSISQGPKLAYRNASAHNVASWTGSETDSDAHWGASVQNWVGDGVKTISDTSSRRSRSNRTRSRSHSRPHSEQQWDAKAGGSASSWDGFERPKTLSEIGSVGSHGDWNDSNVSSPPRATSSRHRNHRRERSRTSRRSTTGRHSSRVKRSTSPLDWNGSQNANVGGWSDDETDTETEQKRPRNVSRASSRRKSSRYANGYDEDNETYLNESWDGVAVRVRSRRSSVAGWH